MDENALGNSGMSGSGLRTRIRESPECERHPRQPVQWARSSTGTSFFPRGRRVPRHTSPGGCAKSGPQTEGLPTGFSASMRRRSFIPYLPMRTRNTRKLPKHTVAIHKMTCRIMAGMWNSPVRYGSCPAPNRCRAPRSPVAGSSRRPDCLLVARIADRAGHASGPASRRAKRRQCPPRQESPLPIPASCLSQRFLTKPGKEPASHVHFSFR